MKPEHLEEAMRVMRGKDPFDRVLIELGLAGEREALQARAREMGMPFVDLERTPIDAFAVDSVPAELARKHNAIPLKRQDRQMWVAMANPQNIQAIDELSKATGCRIIPVVAVADKIEAAIRTHYPD